MLITKHGILEEFPLNMLEEAPEYDFVGSWEAQWELTKAQIADSWNRRGHDRMVVVFTTTYAFSSYYH